LIVAPQTLWRDSDAALWLDHIAVALYVFMTVF